MTSELDFSICSEKPATVMGTWMMTLPASTVRGVLRGAGLQTVDTEPYTSLKHEVEQAVVRDVVFACNTEEEL